MRQLQSEKTGEPLDSSEFNQPPALAKVRSSQPQTRELLTDILDGEESHIDFIETRLGLVSKMEMGLENYIQLQSEDTH